ncbi:MAG: MATE family efflux transporter [Parachlamydiaceae bacterium]|nr:MATE family efflux transporter [Parachlamydiaceae bacterium]
MALTKHPEGSLRELWSIALPLMISSLSVLSMIFVDRLLLANYSTQAFNAAVTASTLGWAFFIGWMTMGSIAEVFVAQLNGAGQKEKLGGPVWQMIWLSIGSILCFLPLSIWGGEWFYGNGPEKAMERDYFTWMMLFGPSCPLYSALCAFFVGQGKPKIITWLAIIANAVNAGLDAILIFGIDGYVPSLGVTGAAIATCGSTMFQLCVLAVLFLSRKNRLEYGTGNYHFHWESFWQCFKIGAPNAIFVVLEIFAWAMFYAMMTMISEKHITVAGIGQSFVLLFFFFADGVSKAVSTLAGNLIGANKTELIQNVMKTALKLNGLFFVFGFTASIFAIDILIAQFLPNATPAQIEDLHDALLFCLASNSVYLFFEGVRMVFSGVLTAAGDTLFLLVAGSLSIWILLVLPIYFIVVQHASSIEAAVMICVFYSIAASIIYGFRVYQGRWQEMRLTA